MTLFPLTKFQMKPNLKDAPPEITVGEGFHPLERQLPISFKYFRLWVMILLAGLLVGCFGSGTPEAALTPTPTFANVTGDAYTIMNTQACLIKEFPTIQTDENRNLGNLMAWSPDGEIFSYITPFSGVWGWYDGNLVLYSAKDGNEQVTRDIKVGGDLTWSPDGSRLAFLALRLPENRYTVMVRSMVDGSIQDLFATLTPTDSYSSQKGIVGWKNSSVLQISESCGVDCAQILEYDLSTGATQTLEEVRATEDPSLRIQTNLPTSTPNPEWLLANYSPDFSHVFFVDSRDVLWLADPNDQTKYPLDIGFNSAEETSWSPDSRTLAVRGQEKIFLFSLDCP